MTYEHNAFELGLDRLVDFDLADDACISVAAYRRIQSEGVSRQINGVTFDGDPFPALNNVKWDASIDGATVGQVTSAIYSPRLNLNIGYCWLPIGESTMGRQVQVATEWGPRTATVVEMPFVDPSKQIPVG